MTTFYIVRHGQTKHNKEKKLSGRGNNERLSETGIRQAKEVRDWFASEGIRIDKVFCSPLDRAKQTAWAVLGEKDFPLITDERLIEMDYGPYEGADLVDPPPEVIKFFQDFVHNPAPEGMEQLSEVVSRAGSLLEELRDTYAGAGEETQNVLLSTHAIAMKGLLEYLTPGSNGAYWSKYIGNCSVYRFELNNGKFSVPYEVWPVT